MSTSTDKWGQLAQLREYTRTTGTLHEAQVLQLKLWPLVALPHIKSHEFTIETWFECEAGHQPEADDVVRDDKGIPRCEECPLPLRHLKSIWFKLKLKPRKPAPRDLKKRLEMLDRNVKALLGEEWGMHVSAGPKAIYRSNGSPRERT